MSEDYLLSKLTWPEVQENLKRNDIAVIPVGSTEQHGKHLPLDNDHYNAFQLSKLVAERLKGEVRLVVCPTIPYGISLHHMAFPGTISLRTETFIELMRDVCRSVIQHGFRKVVIVNGHGGNSAALDVVISELGLETKAHLYLVEFWEIAADVIEKTCGRPVFHADETETSIALALNQRVEMSRATDVIPKSESSFVKYDLYAAPPKVRGALPSFQELTSSGTVGYATRADRENGRKVIEAVIERISAFLIELSKLN